MAKIKNIKEIEPKIKIIEKIDGDESLEEQIDSSNSGFSDSGLSENEITPTLSRSNESALENVNPDAEQALDRENRERPAAATAEMSGNMLYEAGVQMAGNAPRYATKIMGAQGLTTHDLSRRDIREFSMSQRQNILSEDRMSSSRERFEQDPLESQRDNTYGFKSKERRRAEEGQ